MPGLNSNPYEYLIFKYPVVQSLEPPEFKYNTSDEAPIS